MPPSPAELRALLRYEPETGKLFWRPRGFAWWDTRYAGKEAFTAVSDGYRVGRIHDVMYKAHRVIWAMQTGAWPNHTIDHRDLNRSNNRWKNLRDVTHAVNCQNWPLHPKNTSGTSGVTFHKLTGRWRARLGSTYLGLFDTVEAATKARKAAEKSCAYGG